MVEVIAGGGVGVGVGVVAGSGGFVPLSSGKEQFGEQWHSPFCNGAILRYLEKTLQL